MARRPCRSVFPLAGATADGGWPGRGRRLGNLVPAFTHVALINAVIPVIPAEGYR